MFSALWLIPISLWLCHGYSDAEDSPLDLLYFGLTALFWIGHRISSTYLAYCTEAYRPLLRSQPVQFVVLPLLVAAACFTVLLPSDATLPWDRQQRLVALAILDYVFVIYHFASQHFGALSLYRMRAGRSSCSYTRKVDRFFALGVGGVLVSVTDILAGAAAYQDQWIDQNFLSPWLASSQDGIRSAAMVVLLAVTAAVVAMELRSPRWSLPRVLYFLNVSAMVAIALRPGTLFLFLAIWTSQHWILATGLASQVPTGEPPPVRGVGRRMLHRLNTRPWAILTVLVFASVMLLPIFEVEANREEGAYYGDRIFGAIAAELRTSSWVPALLALGFATGFVHHLLDRSVYRMSSSQIRMAARGLLAQTSPR
jgi:hypothetical protein